MNLFLILLVFQSFVFDHDFDIANFEVSQKGDRLNLQIKMDKEDLESLYATPQKELVDLTKAHQFIDGYLEEHFNLVVNDQKVNFQLKEISKETNFYYLALDSKRKITQIIRHIQLTNTCLIEQDNKHSNIVSFNINEKYRTFRMHKDRVRIVVKY